MSNVYRRCIEFEFPILHFPYAHKVTKFPTRVPYKRVSRSSVECRHPVHDTIGSSTLALTTSRSNRVRLYRGEPLTELVVLVDFFDLCRLEENHLTAVAAGVLAVLAGAAYSPVLADAATAAVLAGGAPPSVLAVLSTESPK